MVVSMPAILLYSQTFFSRSFAAVVESNPVMLGLIWYIPLVAAPQVYLTIFFSYWRPALLVGFGVGIIMPLSTGLPVFILAPGEQQEKLMGYSSAMNQMGGVVATLLSGLLAVISWRASFWCTFLGLISMIACFLMIPNDRIENEDSEGTKTNVGKVFYHNASFVVGMFLLMVYFYIYPTDFAIEVAFRRCDSSTIRSDHYGFYGFCCFSLGGLSLSKVKILFQKKTRFVAPIFENS